MPFLFSTLLGIVDIAGYSFIALFTAMYTWRITNFKFIFHVASKFVRLHISSLYIYKYVCNTNRVVNTAYRETSVNRPYNDKTGG